MLLANTQYGFHGEETEEETNDELGEDLNKDIPEEQSFDSTSSSPSEDSVVIESEMSMKENAILSQELKNPEIRKELLKVISAKQGTQSRHTIIM